MIPAFSNKLRFVWTLPTSRKPSRNARTEQDRQLAERIQETLDDLLQTHQVQGLQCFVFGGTVTLYGAIPSYEVGMRLIERLREVPGIRRITNNLRLARK